VFFSYKPGSSSTVNGRKVPRDYMRISVPGNQLSYLTVVAWVWKRKDTRNPSNLESVTAHAKINLLQTSFA